MAITLTGIAASLRSAWADINPLGHGMSFSTQEFLEERVAELEQEIRSLRRELDDARSASAQLSSRAYEACHDTGWINAEDVTLRAGARSSAG